MSFGDYVITEAGFGADLGAEKFYNIKCRKSGLHRGWYDMYEVCVYVLFLFCLTLFIC